MSDENRNESDEFRQLRQAHKDAAAERDALKAQLEQIQPLARQYAFQQAGIDPTSPIGKLASRVYDGPLTSEGIAEWAKAEGIDVAEVSAVSEPSPEQRERSETTQRIDDLRGAAQPVGRTSMSYADYKQLQINNPAAAVEAFKSGQVTDVPAYLADAMRHNSLERSNQLVYTGGDA